MKSTLVDIECSRCGHVYEDRDWAARVAKGDFKTETTCPAKEEVARALGIEAHDLVAYSAEVFS